MKIAEIIKEGGWADIVTQQTKLTPVVVKKAISQTERLFSVFNTWLIKRKIQPTEVGAALGSTAYYKQDLEQNTKEEYGDIDLQIIVPDIEGKSPHQISSMYSKYLDDFLKQSNLDYVYDQGKPISNNVILNIGDNKYVQVDLLWTPKSNKDWSQWRTTPEKGVKGAIGGYIYSTLGSMLNISIQHAGVQIKFQDGSPVNFQKQKNTITKTISKNIEIFGLDILKFIYEHVYNTSDTKKIKVSQTLKNNPGLNIKDVKIKNLVLMAKGLAESFELNKLYGHFILSEYKNKEEFINTFLNQFLEKIEQEKNASKYQKAETDEAKQKVKSIFNKLDYGATLVKGYLNEI